MKGKQVKELLKKKSVRITGAVMAVAIAFGGIWTVNEQATSVPELVSYVDTEDVTTISDEEVPLSNTKVTTSTKTKKTTKKVKLDEKATKTYTSKGKTSTKTSTKTSKTASSKTTTKTTVKTQTTSKYTKGSKVCKQTTTMKTTVTKTVVSSSGSSSAAATSADSSSSTSSTATTIAALAPKVDSRVSTAWNTLGFSFTINSGVSYSGYFDAKSQSITLKAADETVYHELGHFLAFVAGNVDTSSSFVSVYNSEKDLVTAYNKSYVTQDSSEYFAESFKEYTLDAASLKASRPQTYAAIEAALEKVTTAQVSKIATVYASIWK
ncbi:MAG: hypothetical protein LUI13_06020 [Lachnospiraceae bacterium]|nr:hypothetical protein [Lachnospiraceae bacterium]